MTVLQELDPIVIAMRLNAVGGNGITRHCTHPSIHYVLSELFARALSLDKGRNYTF